MQNREYNTDKEREQVGGLALPDFKITINPE